MVNPRKGKIMKNIWCLPKEYERLIDCLEGGFNDEVLNIIYDIYNRGDFND